MLINGPLGKGKLNHPSSGETFPSSLSNQAPTNSSWTQRGPQGAWEETDPQFCWWQFSAPSSPEWAPDKRIPWSEPGGGNCITLEQNWADGNTGFHSDPPDDDSNRNHKQEVPQNIHSEQNTPPARVAEMNSTSQICCWPVWGNLPICHAPWVPLHIKASAHLILPGKERSEAVTQPWTETGHKMLMHPGCAAAQRLWEKKAPG